MNIRKSKQIKYKLAKHEKYLPGLKKAPNDNPDNDQSLEHIYFNTLYRKKIIISRKNNDLITTENTDRSLKLITASRKWKQKQ